MTRQSWLSPFGLWRTRLFVFIVALVPRASLLYYRLVVQGVPTNLLGGSDVPGWLGIAAHFHSSRDISHYMLAARPPLHPLILALVYELGGGQVEAAILQVILVGSPLSWPTTWPVACYPLSARPCLPD